MTPKPKPTVTKAPVPVAPPPDPEVVDVIVTGPLEYYQPMDDGTHICHRNMTRGGEPFNMPYSEFKKLDAAYRKEYGIAWGYVVKDGGQLDVPEEELVKEDDEVKSEKGPDDL